MKYRMEIWQSHVKSETRESNDIKNILEWYNLKWREIYDNGGCAFYIYDNGKELPFDEIYKLGF